MKKNLLVVGLVAIVAVVGVVAYQRFLQKPAKTYVVGILVRGAGYEAAVEGYKMRMAELGYAEGQNIRYDIRFVDAKEQLPVVVQEFIKGNVDLIHVYSTPATQEAYKGTKDLPNPIPVVFGSMGDPLIAGVVKSAQRPGTNVTGVASLSTELTAKRLELLKQINPATRRVGFPNTRGEEGFWAASKSFDTAPKAAPKLGIELTFYPVKTKAENATVAKKITRENADGIIVGGDSLIWGSIEVYIAQAIAEKIPFSAFDLSQIKKGALVGVGPDYAVSGKQSADISHKIFRGSDPAEIPVQTPERLLTAVNLKTASAIGITFTPEFMSQVDVVINE